MTAFRPLLPIALSALMVAAPAAAQTNAEALPAPARKHDAWGERSSIPGAALTIKEASRTADASPFRLYAVGVPKGAVFSLIA